MPRFIGRLSASVSSHHDQFLAAFITNIAESEFSVHTTVAISGPRPAAHIDRTHAPHLVAGGSANDENLAVERNDLVRFKHKVRRRKGGTYPLPHLYGHFGLVRLSRLGHDVPWVKA
jgi:hypothetical protein